MALSKAQSTYDFDMKATLSKSRFMGAWRSMRGFHVFYVGAIVGLAIATLARTGSMLLIGWFVDDLLSPQATAMDYGTFNHLSLPAVGTTHPDLPAYLPIVALGFLALAVVQGVFSFLSGRWSSYAAERTAWRMRNYLFNHLQRLSFSYHDRMQTGELLQRVTSDVEAIRRFYVEQGVGIGRIFIMFSVNMIAIMFISVPLGVMSVVVIPVLVVVSFFFFRKIENKYEEFQNQEARLSTTLQEHLSGVRVVRAFARQEHETQKFEHENWEKFQRGKELVQLNSTYWPMTDLLTGLQYVFGFGVAALLVVDGNISIGDFVAYAGLINTVIEPMRQLGRLVVQSAQGLGSYSRVAELIKEEREALGDDLPAPVDSVQGEVVFENVDFAYDSETPVLHDVNFRCEPGQTIALLGATGSGKTSLVNILPRFYDYTGGSIRIDGVELREYPKAFLRQQIGIIEQEPFLFSRSIRENITYGVGREVTDDEVYAATRAAAVHDVILGFPEGYQTLVGERGVTLSGGQKQRVALARTLLKNPNILILDDATSSVDTETEAAIREALNGGDRKRTTFVIAHRVTTLMHADMILVLEDGRIVQSGTHDDLLAVDGIYRETYEMQSRIDDELEKELAHV